MFFSFRMNTNDEIEHKEETDLTGLKNKFRTE